MKPRMNAFLLVTLSLFITIVHHVNGSRDDNQFVAIDANGDNIIASDFIDDLTNDNIQLMSQEMEDDGSSKVHESLQSHLYTPSEDHLFEELSPRQLITISRTISSFEIGMC